MKLSDDINKIFNDALNITPISQDEFQNIIEEKLETILKSRFPESKYKQWVRYANNRINFACPFCGDSSHDERKKRGNIIIDGSYKNCYKCFNCGIFMSVEDFFRKFGNVVAPLDASSVEYISHNKPNFKSEFRSSATMYDILSSDEDLNKYGIEREWFKHIPGVCEVYEDQTAAAYLKNRHHTDTTHFLYYRPSRSLFVLNMTSSGRVIGLQVKPIEKGTGARFLTYKLSSIWTTFFNKKDVNVPKQLDDLSGIYSIFEVDVNEPIIVCEGAMDSFLLRNAIATSSVWINPPELVDYLYMYDDDESGQRAMDKKLNEGKKVFLWGRFKKDYNLPDRPKWDWNDVVKFLTENNRMVPKTRELYRYFSGNVLDALELH